MHLLLSIWTALTVLSVPKDKVGTPVLYGSRIVDVNRVHGKVFAPGQRNPRPQVMEFVRRDSVLMLVPERIRRTCGEKSLQRYGRGLRRLARKHPRLPLKDEDEWIFNNQSSQL